jgi:hypothetical protein
MPEKERRPACESAEKARSSAPGLDALVGELDREPCADFEAGAVVEEEEAAGVVAVVVLSESAQVDEGSALEAGGPRVETQTGLSAGVKGMEMSVWMMCVSGGPTGEGAGVGRPWKARRSGARMLRGGSVSSGSREWGGGRRGRTRRGGRSSGRP